MTKRRVERFEQAPVGTPALEACALCGGETGNMLLKMRGASNEHTEYTGPRHVATEQSRCEFCRFIEMWCAHEGHEPTKDGRVGAAKIVEVAEDGSHKLVAFVPFTEHEDRDKCLADGTAFTFQHRMVLEAQRREGGFSLVRVLEQGLP